MSGLLRIPLFMRQSQDRRPEVAAELVEHRFHGVWILFSWIVHKASRRTQNVSGTSLAVES